MRLTMKRNKKGFTLLEIIIVVIIVGVLASLALPRLFSTVEFSRSTEAMSNIGSVRQGIERCMARLGSAAYASCDTFIAPEITDIPNPNGEAGAHFGYTVTSNANGYVIVATRTTLNSGAATSIISVTVNTTAATITKVGATAFLNI